MNGVIEQKQEEIKLQFGNFSDEVKHVEYGQKQLKVILMLQMFFQ